MDFLEERFPIAVSVGSTGGPSFSTDVDEVESGREYRNANWSQSRHRWNVATGVGDADAWADVKSWFMRCFGRAVGFRFQDPGDHSSADDGWDDPSPTDQPLGVGDGSTREFGLVKQYGDHVRIITKPTIGSVLIAIDGVRSTNGWSVDTRTGTVRFSEPPAVGAVLTAGFLFDVPARFDSDELTASWSDANLVSGHVGIVELKVPR